MTYASDLPIPTMNGSIAHDNLTQSADLPPPPPKSRGNYRMRSDHVAFMGVLSYILDNRGKRWMSYRRRVFSDLGSALTKPGPVRTFACRLPDDTCDRKGPMFVCPVPYRFSPR